MKLKFGLGASGQKNFETYLNSNIKNGGPLKAINMEVMKQKSPQTYEKGSRLLSPDQISISRLPKLNRFNVRKLNDIAKADATSERRSGMSHSASQSFFKRKS